MKLAKLEPSIASNGLIVKARKRKAPYDTAYAQHVAVIERPEANFDITKLSQQINEECIFSTARNDESCWGDYSENERSYCVTLITRIEDMLQSKELACVFKPSGKPSLTRVVSEFLDSKDDRVLRISLKYLAFAHNAREIVANAIGRHFLTRARNGDFRNRPLVVFLDEAHQFLDKSLGDENTKFPLDSFELIAKEGRKFCLNICIATQRPRDIPDGVLSQMGTMLVHRLTNEKDREVVEKASGDIDRSAAAFLPTLAPGQAVIIGVDFAIPFTVQVSKPEQEPDSRGPDYQNCWRVEKKTDTADVEKVSCVGDGSAGDSTPAASPSRKSPKRTKLSS
ncbi:MAG: ATP-binding protein [Thermoguttaceae bacterium]